MSGGNMQVFGLNATTGGILWEYDVDLPTWNFAPLFPGDGSFVFMDFAGGTYRVDLYNGTEIWKTLPADSRQSFSDGGATLGPNQMVYTCSNFGDGTGSGLKNSTGIVRAFGLKAGDLIWQRHTDSPCNSWPAVGSLKGVDSLAAVVTPGAFVGLPDLHASILALNAETGEDIWNVVLTGYTGPLPFFQAAGDTEGLLPRLMDGIQPACLPAHFSAPNIDKNGVVYVGRCDGNLYVIYGPQSVVRDVQPGMLVDNASGMVGEMFNLGSAPLHGAMGFAPGMFTYSTSSACLRLPLAPKSFLAKGQTSERFGAEWRHAGSRSEGVQEFAQLPRGELPDHYSLRFMAERGRPSPLPQPSGSGRCLLAVGLEEGWREDEVAMLKEAGFQPLRLGDRPLTTELQEHSGV
eukprot:s608_g6.t1